MSLRCEYRHYAPEFKIQLWQNIRTKVIGRRDAARQHPLSSNLIQRLLSQYDWEELSTEEAEASSVISE